MELLNILLVILGAIGLSHIVADSSIAVSFKYWLIYKTDVAGNISKRFAYSEEYLNLFPELRGKKSTSEAFFDKVVDMMNCHQCNGFWSGIVAFGLYWIGWDLLLWAFTISLLSPLWAAVYVSILNFTTYEEIEDDDDGGEDEE